MLAGLPEFDAGLVLIRSHHERIDGRGYPDGLTGDKIPLGARIMALADGFDAMASARPYRGALPPETVLGELERGRGTQWDADAVDTLLTLIESGRIVLSEQSDHPQIVDGAGFVPTLRAA
jgi:HD-GYP domain-containing protein (c-di-GMP phosphodiesterase class II)